ncbi:MAG: hypothetical protein ACKPJD_18100 [Planctomycetaceae bacterium]
MVVFRLQGQGGCVAVRTDFLWVRRVQRASLGRAGEGYVKGPF